MRALSASELLNVWERGLDQHPIQRALVVLAAACPETEPDALARLSIGERDARLLTLREWTFGPQLVSVVACPNCGEGLELTCNVVDIRVEPEAEVAEALSLSVAGCDIRFRLPNSLDLVAVADGQSSAEAQQMLLERCILSAHQNGEERAAGQLPAEVVVAIVERMAQADPQAETQLSITCPACSHLWQAIFDIVPYFWAEINVWAYRILREVHTLALAYGWREADILAMSPRRRQLYLEMLGA